MEKYQYYKEKYKLPTIIDENDIEGKTVYKYIEEDEYVIILFKDNTCLVIKGTESGYQYTQREDDIWKEDFIHALKYEFPECNKEYEENRNLEWKEMEDKKKYEQYLKLKKEFE
jgi:hypothetical protein